MSVEEPSWEVDPDDDWGVAVIATVGRQLRLRREAVGMRAAEFAVADEVEQYMAARMARKTVFERSPAPELSFVLFVLEEWTLRRPLGGRDVLRRQLEHLLQVAELRQVGLQMMPMGQVEHVGLSGGIEVLKFEDGSAVGRSPAVVGGKPVTDLRRLRVLELRHGILRSQALTPHETTDAIRGLPGET
ncbi:DUF5753 domain-containing protein [Streptomyces sp. NPDC048266]|uniref:DUF5753 domain-containing protein n=1 Tax=Streptomyces sp. NPDC048266 TaxID=3155787 RepID=UPI0033D11A9B